MSNLALPAMDFILLLDAVGDPLHEVGRVLVQHIEQFLINLLGRHADTEQGFCRVTTTTRINSAHRALGEHLMQELCSIQSAILLGASRNRGKTTLHQKGTPLRLILLAMGW